MIMHSDNTATDIAIRFAQVERVRRFITDIGLTDTLVPDSTRIFFGYLLGAPDYLTFTWDELVDALDRDAPFVNPPLNNVESLASSADDLVSFYQRALQGEFFQFPETLAEFRRILTLADAIARVFPLGVTGFAKGGSIDVPGFHCISLPGAMAFDDRWVYFAITINWNSPALADPATVNAFANGVSETLKLLKVALSR
jgi:beta-lactamase class A